MARGERNRDRKARKAGTRADVGDPIRRRDGRHLERGQGVRNVDLDRLGPAPHGTRRVLIVGKLADDPRQLFPLCPAEAVTFCDGGQASTRCT
jgi:hypothetical protein